MTKVNLKKITERQKLIIHKGLLDYSYIQNNWRLNDKDFQNVYFDFYLKGGGISNKKEKYFQTFYEIDKNTSFNKVLDKLLERTGKCLLSFASKMLHTVNEQSPIYDSYVAEYLDIIYPEIKIKPKKQTKQGQRISSALDKWNKFNLWFKSIKYKKDREEMIKWFNNNFRNYINISDVKKIDFIIWSWVKTHKN